LKSLDASQLGKRITKDKLPRDEKTIKPAKPAKKVLPEVHESSHDEYSDEEDLSDVVNDALDADDVEKHQWDQEQSYEQQPRKGDSQWRKKESSRLPVRTVTGKLMELEASESESEVSDDTEESDSDSDVVDAAEEPVEEIAKVGKEAVIQVKETLAKLAGEILEEPQEKVSFHLRLLLTLSKVSNLKTFRELFNKGNLTIQKLALVTQLTIYKDIIPGYFNHGRVLIIDTEYENSVMSRKLQK
jgi:nucleolar complex protein 3